MPRSRASADKPLDAVAPPVEPAEQAHQDHLGVRADAVDPEIDRHRMAQVAQMREPHARQRVASSAAQAAARPARSLSANDSTATSPGVWPRSTGSTMLVEARAEVVARRCIASARVSQQRASTPARSSPLRPMTTRRPWRASRGRPGAVVLVADARADRLHQKPHRLAGDGGETLHAQHVVAFGEPRRRARRARPGSAISGSGTTKLSKSSWSWSSSSS